MLSNSVSLNSLDFSLVGPGKVGSSLAHWLVSSGARLNRVAARDPAAAQLLVDSLGGRATALSQLNTAEDDLLVVAVSDPALEKVASVLAQNRQAAVVLHTSGRFTSEALAPLRQHNSAVGSLHPLKAFASVLADRTEASGSVFGIDGDQRARSVARRIVAELAGVAVLIPPSTRGQYHLAATMAAGGVVTLLASAAELADQVGLGPEIVAGYLELAGGAVQQAVSARPIARAITGPVARGDMTGFSSQIDEIRSLNPELADFLTALARLTRHHCELLDSGGPELPRP